MIGVLTCTQSPKTNVTRKQDISDLLSSRYRVYESSMKLDSYDASVSDSPSKHVVEWHAVSTCSMHDSMPIVY